VILGYNLEIQGELAMSTDLGINDEIAEAADDFLKYPLYKVASVFTEKAEVIPAVEELRANGFAGADIEAYCGWKGADTKTYPETTPGIWENFVHAATHVGPARTYLERYERHLQDGDCVISVKVSNKEQKALAAEILHRHTNERVTYFGLLMADEIQ
jgi:hypothetical protein